MLLDPLPGDYEGWLIRTDYRIGVQIALCLQDEELTQEERLLVALSLLYGNGLPPLEQAVEGLGWFLRCGEEKREEPTGGKQMFWFDFDHARIAASFRQTFGIELHRERLHWFEFMAMLDSLDEDCSLSNAVQVRGTDTAKMTGKRRADFERMKKRLTPPVRYSPEEQDAIEAFWAQFEENKDE